jgi:hypothetical protein
MQAHFRHMHLEIFLWYKKLFNPMNFDPSNHFLKIQKSIMTPTLKVRAHLGVCGLIPSHFPALPRVWIWLLGYTFSLHLSMPVSLVASPKLKSWQCMFNTQVVMVHFLFPTLYFEYKQHWKGFANDMDWL